MTEHELTVLLKFLTGGVLVGVVGHWFDRITEYIRKG